MLQAPAVLASLSPTAHVDQLERREQQVGQGTEPEPHSGKGLLL